MELTVQQMKHDSYIFIIIHYVEPALWNHRYCYHSVKGTKVTEISHFKVTPISHWALLAIVIILIIVLAPHQCYYINQLPVSIDVITQKDHL